MSLWFPVQFLTNGVAPAVGAAGLVLGMVAVAATWRAPRRAAVLMALGLVLMVALSAMGTTDAAQAALDAAGSSFARLAFVTKYLAWTSVLIAPALMMLCADKPAYDDGRTDPFGIYVVSVSGLFTPRVLFFCLVFSGFWLMFNQVFDLLPNVIDDWVDSSGIILTVGKAFSSPVVPTMLAVVLGAVLGGLCAVVVWLAMRPDHRPATEVPTPAYVVVAIALSAAAWFPLVVLVGRPWATLAPLVGLLAAALVRARRLPANPVAVAAAVVGTVGGFLWMRAAFLDSAPGLVGLAEAGEQVNPEWMINLNPGLIVFTMVFFAWLSSFVRPLTSIIIGMVIATAGSIVAGTATLGWICLAGILVFSIGEMLSSPKKMEYLATLSPKGSEGLFMGYANIPVAIGWISGSIFAGNKYEQSGDKVNLARRHLAEVVGMEQDAVDALQKTDVMPTLAEQLGMTVTDAQHLLFETYHPEALWLDIGLVGLVSIVGMIVYDRVIRAVDGKKRAEAAA